MGVQEVFVLFDHRVGGTWPQIHAAPLCWQDITSGFIYVQFLAKSGENGTETRNQEI